MNVKKEAGFLLITIAVSIGFAEGFVANFTEIEWWTFSGTRYYRVYQPYSNWVAPLFLLGLACFLVGSILLEQVMKEAFLAGYTLHDKAKEAKL